MKARQHQFKAKQWSQRSGRKQRKRPVPEKISHFQKGGIGMTGELKSLDIPNTTYSLTTTRTVTPINIINTGTSFFNRIGRKIHVKSIHLRGYLAESGNALAAPDYLRIALVYDKQINGVTASWSDIWQETDLAGAQTTNTTSQVNLNNRDRFQILKEWKIHTPGQNATPSIFVDEDCCVTGSIEAYLKTNLEVQYKADAGLVTDLATGGLYLTTAGTIASGTHPWDLDCTIRVRFVDN